MDSLSFNTVLAVKLFKHFNNSKQAQLKASDFFGRGDDNNKSQQLLFRRKNGNDWIVVVRKISGDVKGYLEKINGACLPLTIKGLPSYLKIEHIENAKSILEGSQVFLMDYIVEFTPRLRGGMPLTPNNLLLSRLNFILKCIQATTYQDEDLNALVLELFDLSCQLEEKGNYIDASRGYDAILTASVNLSNCFSVYQFKQQALLKLNSIYRKLSQYDYSYINKLYDCQNFLKSLEDERRRVIEQLKHVLNTQQIFLDTRPQVDSNVSEVFKIALNVSTALEEWNNNDAAKSGYFSIYKGQEYFKDLLSNQQRIEIRTSSLEGLVRTEKNLQRKEFYKNQLLVGLSASRF